MTTMTTKTAARKAYKKAKSEYLTARARWAILNRQRDELCSGYHFEPEEYECNLECQAARAEMRSARTRYMKSKAVLKSLFHSSARVSYPICDVLLVAA